MANMHSRFRSAFIASCAALALAIAARGQGSRGGQQSGDKVTQDTVNVIFNSVIKQIKEGKQKGNAAQTRRAITENWVPYILLVSDPQGKLLGNFRSQVQEWRTDVQVGSTASSPGTTSLASLGSVPSLLGLAVENGALTQTTSGTSVTLRTNPTGLITALTKQRYAASGPDADQDAVVKFLRRTSASVTFNTSPGTLSNSIAGSLQQISGFSFRYDIINHRDPRDPVYNRKWVGLVTRLANLATKVRDFGTQVRGDIQPETNASAQKAKFHAWQARSQSKVDGADAASAASAVLEIARDFVKTFGNEPAVKQAADDAARAVSDFLSASDSVRSEIEKSPILTFEYTDTRQGTVATAMTMAAANASPMMTGVRPPDLSNFKLILAAGTVKGATLTGNASVTLFNSIPAGTKTGRLRDFQLSGQVDVPLREISNIGVPTFSASALFLSLQQQPLGMPVLVNGVMESMKGNIGVGQAKITFPVKKGSGIKIPLSFTYASRTELNKEHDVRGNIGVTFDLDSIFAGLKQ